MLEHKEADFEPPLVVLGFPSLYQSSSSLFIIVVIGIIVIVNPLPSFPPPPPPLLYPRTDFILLFIHFRFRFSSFYFFCMDSLSHLPSPISSNFSYIYIYIFCSSSTCSSPYFVPLAFPLPSLTSGTKASGGGFPTWDFPLYLLSIGSRLFVIFLCLCNCLFVI